ncbi:MAG TPA: serine/threonine-protein kinase [Candidatus Polarisedimenticolaceae bacterium]
MTGRIGDEARERILRAQELPPGSIVAGRFRIESPLGMGGGGEVHVAADLETGARVALKLLAPGAARCRDEAFEREPRLALRLDHRGLARTLALGEFEGRAWLATELVEGETLAARLRRGALPAKDAARTLLELLDALDYLHAAGVVHRDVKPGNVVLSPSGAKILDYGLARRMGVPSPATGEVWGTAEYLSPEQVRGEAGDHRADLYAASVVLWELLTGEPPFRAATPLETARERARRGPRPPPTADPDTAALLAVAVRGLAPSPEDRFPSARAMAEAIRLAPGGPSARRDLRRALRDDADRLAGRAPRAERLLRVVLPLAVAAAITLAGLATWWVKTRSLP